MLFSRERALMATIAATLLLSACGGAAPESASTGASPSGEPTIATTSDAASAEANLAAVRAYTQENAAQMKVGTAALAQTAQAYYDLIEAADFDYEAAWAANPEELTALTTAAKEQWLTASTYYELDEGIIAGVPSLAEHDVLIDAGPSREEDPEGALAWTLELPDGNTLDSPGNYFHSLLEPTLWGTEEEYVGAAVDLDGDGTVALGEVLPDANVLLATAQGLDAATQEMMDDVNAWEPTLTDAFTALVVMIPTMSEYFEQWKLSSYIAGENAEETAFVGTSRLFDINGILNGLNVTYENISPLVADSDPATDAQIKSGFEGLISYVSDLYEQEQAGTRFTAEQAELYGTEAQSRATALVGQVAQAAALLSVQIEE